MRYVNTYLNASSGVITLTQWTETGFQTGLELRIEKSGSTATAANQQSALQDAGFTVADDTVEGTTYLKATWVPAASPAGTAPIISTVTRSTTAVLQYVDFAIVGTNLGTSSGDFLDAKVGTVTCAVQTWTSSSAITLRCPNDGGTVGTWLRGRTTLVTASGGRGTSCDSVSEWLGPAATTYASGSTTISTMELSCSTQYSSAPSSYDACYAVANSFGADIEAITAESDQLFALLTRSTSIPGVQGLT